MTMPSVVGVAAESAGITAATTYNWPAGYTPTAGHVAYLVVESQQTAGVTAPTGWSDVSGSPRPQGTNVTCINVFRKILVGGESAPQVPAATNHQIGAIIVLQDVDTTGTPEHVTAGSGANSGNMSATGVTTTLPDCLILICSAGSADVATDNYSALSNASLANLTEQQDAWTTNGGGGGILIATGEKATAGATGTTTATITTASATSNLVIAVLGASAPPPAAPPLPHPAVRLLPILTR